jgi:thymidine phosphorylase
MSSGLHSTPDHSLLGLKARRLGVVTADEAVVFMREDCHVCRAEGLGSRARVLLTAGDRSVVATLYQVTSGLLGQGEAGLSEAAWQKLGAAEGAAIVVSHPPPLESFSDVRARIFGNRLEERQFAGIIADVATGRYSVVETAAFLTAGSAFPLDEAETTALTRVMVAAGQQLSWGISPIVDKHCIGGLPGNRTTPIVVAIVTALGLTMPKTSSRAITSPAGTADTMETLAPVDLDVARIRRVVENEGGCVVWGGAVNLSPADDLLIRVERVLDLDSEGQLVASVLSKKIAAGASHLVLDLPVGPTAKLRSAAAAEALSARLIAVAEAFEIRCRALISDGSQPVGFGIGPALEARDVLAVLRQIPGYPVDLQTRACTLAGAILELAGRCPAGAGAALAAETLRSRRAWEKFQRICEAQGGMRQPPVAAERRPWLAPATGIVTTMDNRVLARVAKLAGAPAMKAAGVDLRVKVGDRVSKGQPLFYVHAETSAEIDYALHYANLVATPITVAVNDGKEIA